MKWAVEIQKTSLEHRNLADLLDGLEFSLVNGIGFPKFTSPLIDRCGTPEQVFEIAKKLIPAFKDIDPQFTLGAVIDYSINPPKPNYFLELQGLVCATALGNVTLTVSPPSELSEQELEIWLIKQGESEYQSKLEDQRSRLEPVFWSPRAKKVLELLAIEHPSGEIIYKIYELAQGPASNRDNFHAQFGISKNQFDRFKDAVHSPQISGDWARHAYGHRPNTPNPMSQNEAELFIRHIADQWLKSVRTNKSDS